jgi:hypothetical protein
MPQIYAILLPQVLPYIIHIFITMLTTYTFPMAWKISKIVPISKKNKPVTLSDYHPISILPVLSKAMQVIVKRQIITDCCVGFSQVLGWTITVLSMPCWRRLNLWLFCSSWISLTLSTASIMIYSALSLKIKMFSSAEVLWVLLDLICIRWYSASGSIDVLRSTSRLQCLDLCYFPFSSMTSSDKSLPVITIYMLMTLS